MDDIIPIALRLAQQRGQDPTPEGAMKTFKAHRTGLPTTSQKCNFLSTFHIQFR